MNENNKTLALNKRIVLTGAFSALIIVLTVTKLGFISLSPTASITILQIPVILITMLCSSTGWKKGFILNGLFEGIFVGAVMGIMSLIQAAMSPSGALDPFFVNPLCSVLPRILLGVAAWALWKLLGIFLPKPINAAVTGFLATVMHTIMVIGCLYLFTNGGVKEAMGGTGYFALLLLLAPNAALEACASAILCTAVYIGLFVAGKKKSKLSEEIEEIDGTETVDGVEKN
ncbi:MAG: ECF transporter S component [Treponema sp.]|nr:ECF transporter S component [Treponema sp.]